MRLMATMRFACRCCSDRAAVAATGKAMLKCREIQKLCCARGLRATGKTYEVLKRLIADDEKVPRAKEGVPHNDC